GEGIETTLSLRCALPDMAMAAALSAAHLAAMLFPPNLRRLYVILDNDPAGDGARHSLLERATDAGIEAIVLSPETEDFNEDLRHFGLAALRASIADQLMRKDRICYLTRAA
ncbi:DNA primase, partial [Mesorhizobium sp. M7A.F.Ca.US.006.04.2.1]